MCVWTMLEVCFLQTQIPGATLPEPPGSEQTIQAWLSVSQRLRREGHRPQEVVAPGL